MRYKTIKTLENQNLLDISMQEYGGLEGVYVLLEDNPHLESLHPDKLDDYGQDTDGFYDHTLGRVLNLFFLKLPDGIELKIREGYILTEESYVIAEYFKKNEHTLITNL